MRSTYKKRKFRYPILLLLLIFFTILLTVYSDISFNSVKTTLGLCTTSVIPSLFPFMVLSSIVTKMTSKILDRSSSGLVILIPFALGALCGFPVGASSVVLLYKNKILSERKAEYLCALCNNTGPAFIIGVIGKNFWDNSAVGLMFYICQLFSAVAVFFIWYVLFGKRIFAKDTFSSSADNPQDETNYANADNSLCTTFCSSVTDSAVSLLHVCGYIVFFKVICDCISALIPAGESSNIIYAIIASVLEFTSGGAAAANLGGIVGIAVCGFAIGFSGLSVMAQSAGFLYPSGLSVLPLLRLKCVIGIVTGMTSTLCYKSFEFTEAVFSGIHLSYPNYSFNILSLIIVSAYLLIKVFLPIKKLICNSCH